MDATSIVLIVFVAVLLIAYPIMIHSRNKKENQRMQEQTNSLKRGGKVLTTSGVYGTIVDLHLDGDKKIVTIETGTDKKKGYISVDAYAIYTIFTEEEEKVAEPSKEIKNETVETTVVENAEKETENKENIEDSPAQTQEIKQ